MVYKNILVSLCGRGDESIVINEAINIADVDNYHSSM